MPVLPEAALVATSAQRLSADRGPSRVHPHSGDRSPDSLHGIEAVLRKRRAVRSFSRHPVGGDEVLAVVRAAAECYRSQWSAAPADLSLLLAAGRVRGLESGSIYALGMSGVQTEVVPEPIDGIGDLPMLYGEAPVILFVCGDLGSSAAEEYPDLLVRAGAFGHAIWLAALAIGLEGCLYGRAYHRTSAIAHRARPGARHLFTVALGHPDE